MSVVTVHLLRHGEVHNPDHVLYGCLPGFGLSERGHAMARRVADVLSAVPVSPARVGVLVSSPLQRARETVAPLEAALGRSARIDPRVIEGRNDFEGHHVDTAFLLRPRNLVRLWNPRRPSWGEPHAAIAARMWEAIAEAAADAARAGQAALIVSHQLPVWTARCSAEHRASWGRRECGLASLTTLTFDLGVEVDLSRTPDPAGAARAAVRGVDYSEPAAGM